MRIESITLKNFRCFREQQFSFREDFNLLVGDNASGKTAVLEAVTAGIDEFLRGITRFGRDYRKEWARYETYWKGQTLTLEPQFPSSVICEGTIGSESLHWERGVVGPEDREGQHSAEIFRKADEIRQEVASGVNVALPVFLFCRTGRFTKGDMKAVETVGPGSRLEGYKNCLDPRAAEDHFIRWFKTREWESVQRQEPLGVLESVRKALITCIEGATDVRFDVSLDQVVARFNGGGQPYSNLSDGYRSMLAMVAEIASRAAILNPHFSGLAAEETPGIVLIDELDLHLHPRWQRRVVADLMRAFPKVQFIATTHSPFIIQSLPNRASVQLLNLDDPDRDEFANKSIEDIAETVQGIEGVQRSARYHEMMNTAKEYYRLLRNGASTDPVIRERLKKRLDELVQPYSDDPAYQALLEMERAAAGLGGAP